MKNTITFLCLALLLTSCNSVKRNQKFLARGDYDQAITLAVKKLQKDKDAAKNEEHIILLEEAFQKAVAEDISRITFLKKENSATASREIYSLYKGLEHRQQLLRPLLPLYSESLGRNARIQLSDYSDELIASKNNFAEYLYAEANSLLNRNTKTDARKAHAVLTELAEIKPNYKNVRVLLDEAHYRGTDFIFVSLSNRSGQLMPRRLEQELLDFNTYGLDDFWTEYHSVREQGVGYHYGISLNFRTIDVSPERISEKEERRSKRIKEGWEYKRDRNGEIVKDADGNPIKIDSYKTVSAMIYITEQFKAVRVGGNVTYRDLQKRRDLTNYPLATEFVFENAFATYRGDERALNDEDLRLVRKKYLPFPNAADMVYDAGENIKLRLKEILKEYPIR